MAWFYFPARNAFERLFLRIKYDRWPFMARNAGLHASCFNDRAIWSEISKQYGKSACFGIRVINWADDIIVFDFTAGDVFPKRFSGYGQRIEMQRSFFFR